MWVHVRKNRLVEAVLTSTHNLCFEAKIRKIGIPLYTPLLPYKSGVRGNVFLMKNVSGAILKNSDPFQFTARIWLALVALVVSVCEVWVNREVEKMNL